MSYDPAWDMPQLNWQQQGSYEQGSIPPVVEPDAGTQVYLGPVAREWLPWICGALDQLRNPSAWIVADDNAMFNTLRRVDTLLGLVCGNGGSQPAAMLRLNNCVLQTSTDGGVTWVDVPGWDANFCNCVNECAIPNPPLLPPGTPPSLRACNIAGYLANDVIKEAISQAINAYNHDLSLLALAGNIAAATFAFDLPWTAAFIYGVYDLYQFFTAGNIADLTTSEADPALWSEVTCAIYSAIKTDGMVTDGNCAAVIANICAITYAHPIAITTICAYVTQLGCGGLRQAQMFGALTSQDCSGCGGTWCYEWDFSGGLSGFGWTVVPTEGGTLCAYGWCGTDVNPGTPSEYCGVDIIHSFPPHFVVDAAIFAETNTNQGGAVRDVYGFLSGSLVFTYHIPLGGVTTVGGQAIGVPGINQVIDKLQVSWRSAGNCSGVLTQIKAVKLEGTGPNPFGSDNCTF